MKHIIVLLSVVFISLSGHAQRDYDYSIFTSHAILSAIDSGMTELSLYRRVIKKANLLKIVCLENTAICQEYKLTFVGVDLQERQYVFCYQTEDKALVIEIEPGTPEIRIIDGNGKLLSRYY